MCSFFRVKLDSIRDLSITSSWPDILLKSDMQKSFTTQTNLIVSPADLDHPILHSLDDTEALLNWGKIEHLLSPIYSAKTGRPSYPSLTLLRSLLLGIWYQLSDVQLAQCLYRDLLFRKFC
ncbi:MAG: hypothetical protein COA76_08790 [Moritella sp.]|nr:MAG: hypothetical protein COA76_08790 [Moritella sp.]